MKTDVKISSAHSLMFCVEINVYFWLEPVPSGLPILDVVVGVTLIT